MALSWHDNRGSIGKGCLITLGIVFLLLLVTAIVMFNLPQRIGIVQTPTERLLSSTPDREAAGAMRTELEGLGIDTRGINLYVIPKKDSDKSILYAELDPSDGFNLQALGGSRNPIEDAMGLLAELDKCSAGHDTDVSSVLHIMAERLKRRGLVILISDLLDDPTKILSGLRHFRHNKHEVLVFHLLDPKERNFDFQGDVIFEDLETGEKVRTYPWYIRREYQSKVEEYINQIKNQCRENQIDYQLLETHHTLDLALMEYLIKRNRLH